MRKRKLLFPVLLTVLLLSACVRQSPEAQTTGPANTDQRNDETMTHACDAVFFGDSITADSNFTAYFPDRSMVNLGVYGDTLEDLLRRVGEVRDADPRTIFLLGGINSLTPDNVDDCLEQYAALLDELRRSCPRSAVVVESVLPVAADIDPYGLRNDAVRSFNAGLRDLAAEKGCGFADLYAVYEKDGALDPSLTRDGLHLNFTAYGPWAEVITPFLRGD